MSCKTGEDFNILGFRESILFFSFNYRNNEPSPFVSNESGEFFSPSPIILFLKMKKEIEKILAFGKWKLFVHFMTKSYFPGLINNL